MKSYAIAILLLTYVHSQCADGCLSCTDNNECRVCDVTNGYYLSNNTCLLSTEKHCQIFDLSGNCLFCKHGYYTDPNAQQCIALLDNGDLDQNCQRFNLERQCIQCREEYYLLGSKCIQIADTDKITGCLMYNTKTECVECKPEMTLNLQGTQCLENTDVNHCFQMTTVKCDHCKDGYTMNPNFFLESIKISMESTPQNSIYQKIDNFFQYSFFEEGCLQNIGSNCLAYSDFNQCIQCEAGHYLQNGKCYAFPKEQIENCKKYLNQLKCQECQQGYILTGEKNCSKIENDQLIQNCILYDGSSQNIRCIKCKTNYFVNSNLSCFQRNKDIAHCKTLSPTSDTCQECQDNYQITDDGLKCLFEISNCQTYEATNNSSNITQHKCKVCNSGLYFNETQNICDQGQVENCNQYENDPNKCKVCQNQYYLQSDVCIKHDNILNCSVYDQVQSDQCQQCNNTSILMNQTNQCEFVEIQGCEIFISTSSCERCKDGYDLTNNLCTLLNSESNCKRSIDGVCQQCLDQYFLGSDNKCYLPFDYQRLNCFTNKNDGSSDDLINSQCKICQDYSIPYSLTNHNVCISVSELAQIDENKKIANCQRYQIISNEIKCKQCEKTYILSNDKSTCGLDCPNQSDHKLDFKFEQDGVYGYQYKNYYYCVSYSGSNVQSVTLDQDFNVTSLKLDNDYNYLINFDKVTNFKLLTADKINQTTLSNDLFTIPDYKESSIIEPTENSINGDTGFIDSLGNKVEHCEYYFEKHSKNKCAKCEFGYFGKIDFFKIDNCYEYDETTQKCKLCVHQYELADDELSCTLVEIQGCQIYEKNTGKCAICENQYYLDKDNNQCKRSNIENCTIHDPYDEDKCLVCNKGYLLNSNNDLCAKVIDNCQKSVYKDDNQIIICEQCDFGYYTQTDQTQCVKGTIPKCYEYELDSNTCDTYINIFQVTKLNECISQKYQCVEFDNDDPSKCTKCYEEDYYLVSGDSQQEGVCCKYFTYPNDTQDVFSECTNVDTGNPNCKKFKRNSDGGYECQECQYGYFMNPSAQDLNNKDDIYPSTICCPYGYQQDDSATKKCIKKVNYKIEDDNYFECSVFDLDNEKCVLCKTGLYLHKDKCCTIGKYHNGDDNFSTQCTNTDIPADENCNQYDKDNKCIDCKDSNTLSNGICCTTNTQFAKATGADSYECATLNDEIANCETIDSSTWSDGSTVNICKECNDDYYLANDDKACCKIATNEEAEIFSDGQCKSLTTLNQTKITNCEIYTGQFLCKQCTTGFPSTQGKICCPTQEIYDFDQSGSNLNCRSINFVYQYCDYIIKFTNEDNFCKQCKNGYYKINNRCSEYGKYMKKLETNPSGTESDTNIVDSLVSFATGLSTSNCIEVEYVTAIQKPGESSITINKICKKCKDGYELNDLYKDGDYTKEPCIDEKYKQGYYLDTDIKNELVKIHTYTEHCLLFNETTNMCQQTQLNDVFTFGYCANYDSYITYKQTQNQPCCRSGQYYNLDDQECKDIDITDCLIQINDQNNPDTCQLCKDGYYLKDNLTCPPYPSINNCLIFEDEVKCQRCEFGYYLDTAQTSCTVVTASTRALDYCAQSSDGSTCDADSCHPGYYKSDNYCCRLGTYQRATDEECISIPFENCAKYNGTECQECFTFENNYCFNIDDWILTYKSADYSPYINNQVTTAITKEIFADFYHSFNKGCCKEGYKWKTNDQKCEKIEIDNCLQVELDGTIKCIKCEANYKLVSDACQEINSATTGYYESNGIYCQENFYYDFVKQKCIQHPDQNCKQSKNNYTCDECNTGFVQSTFYKKLVISHNAGERDGCINKLPDIVFQPCVQNDADSYPQIPNSSPAEPIIVVDDLFDYDKMFYRRINCNDYDFDNQVCKQDGCKDGYYLVEKRCCKNDEYPLNNSCINKQKLLMYCNSYDISTYKCLGCEINYELSNGYCCQKGYVYNTYIKQCIKKSPNCREFLEKQNKCVECYADSYMDENNYCCPLYQYYDKEQQKCVQFSGEGMIGCKKGNKDQCYECTDQNYYFKYNQNVSTSFQKSNGRCCENGFEYDTNVKACIPLSKNCQEYDTFGNCISCLDGHYKSDIICCPYGQVSDGDNTCVVYDALKHCQQYEFDSGGTHTCNQCIDGYYLVKENCCPYFYEWDTNKCVKIQEPESTDKQQISSVNCKIFNETIVSGSSPEYYTCNECQDGYYLSQESDENYFDRGIKESINRCCPYNMRTQDFTNSQTGCQLIKVETEANQTIIGLPSPESDCIEADYLQLSSLTSLSIDYDQQIICTRCKDNKVVQIKFYDYEAERTSKSNDGTYNVQSDVDCVARTSNHNDRCWAYFVNSSDNIIRYCLNFDHTKYYLTNRGNTSTSGSDISQLQPCEFGEYYHDDSCKSINEDIGTVFLSSIFQHCSQITGTQSSDYVCSKCIDDYYLDKSATNVGTTNFCIQKNKPTDTGIVENCLFERIINSGTNECLICQPGFKMDGSNGCEASSHQDNSQSYYKYCSLNAADDECNYCSELEIQKVKFKTYLTNGACCLEGQYYDTTKNQCYSMENILAITYDSDGTNIEKVYCNYEKDLFVISETMDDKICCKKGTVYDSNQSIKICHVPTQNHLKQCKYFKSNTECRELEDFEKKNLTIEDQYPCFNNDDKYYFHKQACCKEGEYFNSNSCNSYTSGVNSNCSQFAQDSIEDCVKCKDNFYLTNKRCCEDGKYWDLTDTICKDITTTNIEGVDENCKQYIDDQCLKCADDEKVNYQGCCGKNYRDKQGSCQQQTIESIIYQLGFYKCDNGQHLSNNKCCDYGQYNKNGTCSTDDITDNDCLIPDYNSPTNCKLCKTGMKFLGGKCCPIGKFYSEKKNKCIDEQVIMNCLTFNDDKECTKCKSNDDYYINKFMCCPMNTKFDDGSGTCIKIDYECQQYKNDAEECLKCNDGFYVNPDDNQKCCLYGHKPSSYCRQPTMPIDVANCSEFNTDPKCVKCKESYNLYEQVCCPSGKVLLNKGYNINHCVSINTIYQNCDLFDPLQLKCNQCESNYYNDNEQSICCEENKHFDLEQQECVDNYKSCKQQKNDKCTKCVENTYLNGKDKKMRCCPQYSYFNFDENKCIEIEIDNCKEIEYDGNDIICKTCQDSDPQTYLTNDHCCLQNQYWDKKYKKCQSPIKHCDRYDGTKTDAECLECASDFVLLSNKKKCCKRQSFYFPLKEDEECFEQAPLNYFSWECSVYDSINFKCTECRNGYYLMDNHCCEEGTYYQADDTQDCTGSLSPTENCAQGNSSGECTKCKLGYKINTDKDCVQILDNCSQFDADNNKCTKCKQNYFVTPHGYCCLAGQSTSDAESTTCSDANITIDKCIQVEEESSQIKCKLCEEGFYVAKTTEDKCCKYGTFCADDDTVVQGKIENCQQYESSEETCKICYPDYSLMVMKDNVKYCFPTKFENCIVSEFNTNTDSADVNPYECKKCADDHAKKNLDTKEVSWLRPQVEERCLIFDIKQKYEDSSLQCKYCSYDYYLDESDDYKCKERSVYSMENCEIRDFKEDKCIRCQKGYHLNQDVNDGVTDESEKKNQCLKNEKCELDQENTNGDQPCALCKDDHTMILKDLNDTAIEDMTSLSRDCLLTTELNEKLKKDLEPPFQNPEVMPGVINKCEKHYQCKDIYLNGLDINLHKYLTCHVCIDEDRIPFISLDLKFETDNIIEKGIKMYFYKNPQNEQWSKYNENRHGKQSQCFKKNLDDFNVADKEKFPTNCGIGVINANQRSIISQTDQSNLTSIDQLGIFCVACKPGYKPLYSETLDYHVYECQEIQNCEMTGDKKSQSAFNECDYCQENYYHPFTEDQGLDKTRCIQSQVAHDPLCYAFDVDNNYCKACINGYQKNYDDKCEKLQVPYCLEGQTNFKTSFNKEDYRLAMYRGVEGCKECQDGYLPLFRKKTDDQTCIYSSYAKKNSFKTTNQKYPSNCLRFYWENSSVLCSTCRDNFIVTEDKKCVAINNSHKNCLVAQDQSNCHQCNDISVLVQGQCINKNIENCLIYKENEEELLCSICQDGYYLQNNICNGGQILNCARYSTKDICQTCKTGYQLITNKLNQTACIEVITETNCEQFEQNSFNQMEIKCQKCNSQYYLNDQITDKKVCLQFQSIDSCLEYDVKNSFTDSTLQCKNCQIDTYLKDGKCLKRQIKVPNCLQNDPEKDACKLCADNYYLSEDQMECISNPTGVLSCAIYDENSLCILCKPSYYLLDQKCFKLSAEESIENCEAYNNLKECMKCLDGYLLEDKKCILKNIQQCLVYQNSTNCQLCNNGYGIDDQDGVKVCVLIPQITNCINYDQSKPFACNTCQQGFYLNTTENQCIQIEQKNIIEKCLRYSINQTCEACESGYVLSQNQKSCQLLNYQSNCVSHTEQGSPFCIKCDVGYVLNKEYQCVEGPQNQIENCLVTETNNQNVCSICQPGYFMKQDKKCYQTQQDDESEDENQDGEEENEDRGQSGDIDDNNEDNQEDENESSNKMLLKGLVLLMILII